jgi:hypothetical protein
MTDDGWNPWPNEEKGIPCGRHILKKGRDDTKSPGPKQMNKTRGIGRGIIIPYLGKLPLLILKRGGYASLLRV